MWKPDKSTNAEDNINFSLASRAASGSATHSGPFGDILQRVIALLILNNFQQSSSNFEQIRTLKEQLYSLLERLNWHKIYLMENALKMNLYFVYQHNQDH